MAQSARGTASDRTTGGPLGHGLNDVEIVRAAREIIAEVGVDGLTMRELSARLGVALGATYHYLPSRQAVIRRVAQDLFGQVESPSSDVASWREQVKSMVLATAIAVGQYPGMAAYVLAHVDEVGPLRLHDELEVVLRRAGFGEDDMHALQSALYFYGAGIAANFLPVRQAATFARADAQAMFEDGLDMLLAGAELRLVGDRNSRKPRRSDRSR
jgi:AcrR family transcriptional regulator